MVSCLFCPRLLKKFRAIYIEDRMDEKATDKSAVVRAHLFIRGRVQGVGYRAFTVRAASDHGLAGWVRNIYGDGVEAVFEGDRSAIEAAVKLCGEGPPLSIISEIDVNWTEEPERLTGFGVRR
jgi:acylphosphatase